MNVARIFRVFSANAFGQAVTIVVSLASVPVFLNQWDEVAYGRWMLLFTIPAYLANVDFGIGTTTINRLLIERSSPRNISEIIFQASFTMVFSICMLSTISVVTALALFTHFQILEDSLALPAFFLTIYSLLALISPLVEAQFKFSGYYALPVFLLNLQRLVDWIFGIGFFLTDSTFSSTALGFLTGRILSTILLVFWTKCLPQALPWSLRFDHKNEMKLTIAHSGFFTLFPLSNLLILQGSLAVIGAFVGPAMVATFSVYRTLVRAVTQVLAVINKTFWPEFSDAFGRHANEELQRMLFRCKSINLVFGVGSSIFLYFFSNYILEYWTHGKIEPQPILFASLLVGATITSGWQSDWVFAMSTNLHHKLASRFFAASVFAFLLLVIGFLIQLPGVHVISSFVIITELLLFLVCRSSTKGLLKSEHFKK